MLAADVVLVATGRAPRVMDTMRPDGERILTWQQIYTLHDLPERVIVIGSGVTGAELAQAYLGLGSQVVLVSSRDRVLPGEDADAATVIEDVFRKRGMEVLGRSRAASVERTADGVVVTLVDGRTVEGSHALLAVGLGAQHGGPRPRGDRASSSSESGHLAGRPGLAHQRQRDLCGGRLHRGAAARLGRGHAGPDRHVARARRRGGAAQRARRRRQHLHRARDRDGRHRAAREPTSRADVESVMLPLARNPRAKMQGITDGFVKLFCRKGYGTVLGGVVVAPRRPS